VKVSLAKVFFRSFLIQGCWNYVGMQNVGFVFGIAPVLKEVTKNREQRVALLNDQLGFFNTHPYLASAILGATASILMKGKSDAVKEIRELKDTFSNPFAALGDAFFWSTLKPLFSITATAAAFMGSLCAPVIFLVLYNVFHFWIRTGGFIHGVQGKMEVMSYVKRLGIPGISGRLKYVTRMLLAAFAAGAAYFMPSLLSSKITEGWWGLMIVPIFLTAFLVKKGIGVLTQIYIFGFVLIILFSVMG
jgi:PTS system mannose-specific IID component